MNDKNKENTNIINDINDIFNNLEKTNNINTKQNSDFINYFPNFDKENNITNIEEKSEINYSLNDIFIIDEKEIKSDELNINQTGLNENNPYDFL